MSICALALAPSPAAAERVLVLGEDGRTHVREDPIPRGSGPRPGGAERAAAPTATAAARRKRGPTIRGELRRMLNAGAIDKAEHDERRALVRRAEELLRKLRGARRDGLGGALKNLERIAAQGSLTVSRLEALWRILGANIRWFNEGPLIYPGRRVSLEGSELIFQYVAGAGLQIHPLANAGKLNGLWQGKTYDDRLQVLLDELLPLAAVRGGGAAWEYYFPYDSGRPPWISGMAQATMLQAMARASIRLNRRDEIMPLLREGLVAFRQAPPLGVRVRSLGGAHYLLYSFRPKLRVLNGFAQSLVGLYDFGGYANDDSARALFAEGHRTLTAELPEYDTGAWSLYSRFEITRESDLNYHRLSRDFLRGLCTRTEDARICEYENRFSVYMREPPVVRLVTARLRAGRTGQLAFRLSKISRVNLRLAKGDRLVLQRSAVLRYGRRAFPWKPPKRRGTYSVRVTATDLAGNTTSVAGEIRVKR